MTDTGVLELSQITGGYGDITVVRDVSLTVTAGRIAAVFGPNGAGKTTLLRIITGLSSTKSGRITLNGSDITHVAPYNRVRRGVALVQDGKRVFKGLSVEDNLIAGAFVLGQSRRKLRSRIDLAYDRFPILGQRRGRPAGSLSGGQQQMLAIAQALMPDPKVLLLDEPSAGLSPSIVGEVFRALEGLRQDGLAILLVEQAVDAALPIATEATVIDLGRVVLTSPADEPGLRDKVAGIYFGTATGSSDAPR